MNNSQLMTELPEKGIEEIKKSGTDWLTYIEKHPLQTILFGLIGYCAVKGLNK
jgi:hypothetical protein